MADTSKAVILTVVRTASAERPRASGPFGPASRNGSPADTRTARTRAATLALDVNDEASMSAAVSAVEEAEGAVGALVNNAGYSQSGALETIGLDDVRRQFETNVFGLLRMCQLVLPGMRRQGGGRIVNVSSMGGKLTFPGGGIYHATKYAVEAMSDAMRFEVQGFGIDVVVIEPASQDQSSPRPRWVRSRTRTARTPSSTPPFGDTAGAYEARGQAGRGPEAVAKAIEKAITAKRPGRDTRNRLGTSPHDQRKLLPDRAWMRWWPAHSTTGA